MFVKSIKKFFISLVAFSAFIPFISSRAKADYSFSAPNSSWGQSTSESSFSVNTDSMTCSSGGGTAPSLWIGMQGGDGTESTTSSTTTDEVLNGGIAFNIPLGSGSNKGANCSELLAIMEAEEFLSMMKSLQDLNAINSTNAAMLVRTYMTKTGQKLGIDFSDVIENKLGTEFKEDK